MKLHLDREVFKQFINKISSETNITMDILEKDYYVCCILQQLAERQDELQAYFKGGTAVYKILDTMNRFSEDIDLTVKINEKLSKNKQKKIFEETAFGYNIKGLNLNKEKSIKNGKNETALYNYETVFDIDVNPLQKAGLIEVESTSFTVSEPIEDKMIEPIIYKFANADERKKLMENFDVKPIKIKIIKLERIFVDKIFAAEFYYIRKKYIDTAKHIYDLCVLIDNEKIRKLFYNEDELIKLVEYKREEEKSRTEGIKGDVKIKDFSYLKCDFNNDFINGLKEMQDKYITNDKYKIDMDKVIHTLKVIKDIFNEIVI